MSKKSHRTNPYIGPRPYNYDESDMLGGRQYDINRLLNILIAERIVLIHSSSGAGKTSLIEAGLRPELEAEGFWVSPLLSVSKRPNNSELLRDGTNRYILSLLLSLDRAKRKEEQMPEGELAELTFLRYLNEYLPEDAQGKDKVFFFDQFEELLTVSPYDEEGKYEFIDQVGAALRQRDRWALFAIREDYIGGLKDFERPIPSQLSNRYRLPLFRSDTAVKAIQKPASTQGVSFEDDAARSIVDDLRQDSLFVEPVQLQVVCQRLWERLDQDGRLDDHIIDHQDVADLIDVSEALSVYYAESVSQVSQHKKTPEREIRRWMGSKLITNDRIRRQVRVEGAFSEVADTLVNFHIVRKDVRGGIEWYELAHDRLVQPIISDNENWYQELPLLQRRSELWKEATPDQIEYLLLHGDELSEAEKWAAEHSDELSKSDIDFLKASSDEEKRLRAEAKAQEEKLEFAKIEARNAKRIRNLGVLVIVVILIAVTFAAWRSSEDRVEIILSDSNRSCERNEEKCEQAVELAGIARLDGANLLDGLMARIRLSMTYRIEGLRRPKDLTQISIACQNGLLKLSESQMDSIVLPACRAALEEAKREKTKLFEKIDVLNDLCAYKNFHTLPTPQLTETFEKVCSIAAARVSQNEYDLDQVNLTCQNALSTANDEDIELACEEAVRLAEEEDSENLIQVNIACENGLAGLGTEDVKQTCAHAVELASKSPNLIQVNMACENGLVAGLGTEDVKQTCAHAVELASEWDNLIQVNMACENGLVTGLSIKEARKTCEQADDLASNSQNLVLVNQACQNSLVVGIDNDGACSQAARLADDTENLVQVNMVCRNSQEAELSEGVIESICKKAVQIAMDWSDFVQVNLACRNGRLAGLDIRDVQEACGHAITFAQDSEDIDQVNQACQNQFWFDRQTNDACNRLEKLVEESANPRLVYELCFTNIDELESPYFIKSACPKAAELSKQSNDTQIGLLLCSLQENEAISSAVKDACNNTLGKAKHLDPGVYQNSLESGVPALRSFDANPGDRVSISMVHAASTDLNPYLMLYGPTGMIITEDDDGGGDQNALIQELLIEDSARYVIVASGLEANAGMYTLEFQIETYDDQVLDANEASVALDLCLTGIKTMLPVEDFGPACKSAADLSRQTNDIQTGFQLCTIRENEGGSNTVENERLSNVVESACTYALAQAVELNSGVNQHALESGTTDLWSFDADAGARVTISMDRDSSADLNPYLILYGPSGMIITEDDDGGDSPNALIPEFLLEDSGKYVIAAADLGANGGTYTLGLQLDTYDQLVLNANDASAALDLCLTGIKAELSVGTFGPACKLAADLSRQSNDISTGLQLCSIQENEELSNFVKDACIYALDQAVEFAPEIEYSLEPNELDLWSFNVEEETAAAVTISMDRDPSGNLDPYLTLYGPSGTIVTEDDDSGGNLNALIQDETLKLSGRYVIAASGLEGSSGDYTLTKKEGTVDPYSLRDICLTTRDSDLEAVDIQSACEKAVELSINAKDSSLLKELCFASFKSERLPIALRSACEPGVELAFEFNDINILRDYCLFGAEVGENNEDFLQACGSAADLAITADEPDLTLLSDLCLAAPVAEIDTDLTKSICMKAAALSIEHNDIFAGYRLCLLQSEDFFDGELEVACETAQSQLPMIEPGVIMSGTLDPDSIDYWLLEIDGEGGQVVRIAMDSDPSSEIERSSDIEPFDPYLTLFSLDGRVITKNDDGGEDSNALILGYVAEAGESLIIEARDLSRGAGNYNLYVDQQPLNDGIGLALLEEDAARLNNNICWYGSLAGYEELVLPTCNRAVELAVENNYRSLYSYRDSRGLARALAGEVEKAIEDFEYYIEITTREERRLRRMGWIEKLKEGQNPFDSQTLEELKYE